MNISDMKAFYKFNPMHLIAFTGVVLFACASPGNKQKSEMNEAGKEYREGTYGYDARFLSDNDVETIELTDENGNACVLIAPGYQGRVMTSSASGQEGVSYGWINHRLIDSGEVSKQFNPVGGEERIWLGPEGGLFSLYFEQGKEQVFENWKVPAVIDTEPFEVKHHDGKSITFSRNASLVNASGTEFELGIERSINLFSTNDLNEFFDVDFSGDVLDVVGYQTENIVTNRGAHAWKKEDGLISIWLLCMFSPSPTTTVFVPYQQEGEGPVVNDEYFGKVPSDRLIVEDGVIYFKIDGEHRSKIGIPPGRAKELCGSYDSARKVLTLVWGFLPEGDHDYVNSKWGEQDDPYAGDAINAYNDGPVDDGSVMGPFYEIETSSPGAALNPGASIRHSQVVVHVQGGEEKLAVLVDSLFGLQLKQITSKFN